MKKVTRTTRSPTETENLGYELGRLLPVQAAVGLVGELGSGKTCFVRGLARGLGLDPDEIASPTFVYLVDYDGGRSRLTHADLYRLVDQTEDIAEEAFESIGLTQALASAGITVVEWWDSYRGPQPADLVTVEFLIENVDVRSITLTFDGAAVAGLADRLEGTASR